MSDPTLSKSVTSKMTQTHPAAAKHSSEVLVALKAMRAEWVEPQRRLKGQMDGLIAQVSAQEERIKRLEQSLLTHLESATWVKAATRFCPFILAALLLGHQVHTLWFNASIH